MDASAAKLYYYTTTQTMYSILTSGVFWATNILYMNDSEEYVNGLREIRDILASSRTLAFRDTSVIDKLIHVQDPHIFTLSFCTNEDLLSQWCVYARESGVNLELDLSLLETDPSGLPKFFCLRDGKGAGEIEAGAPLRPVIYFTRNAMLEKLSPAQVHKREAEIVERIRALGIRDGQNGAEEMLSELAAQIKRYEFSAEQEWRLLFNMTEHAGEYDKSPFFYREQDNILKPFIKVAASGRNKAAELPSSPWPVTAITVGPGYNQDQVFQSLRYFLNFGNYIRRNDQAFWTYALDLYMGKVAARCRPLFKKRAELEQIINSYQTRARPPLSNANIMRQLASAFKKDLVQKFPKCTEVLGSIELTSDGIILQKSSIPYIY